MLTPEELWERVRGEGLLGGGDPPGGGELGGGGDPPGRGDPPDRAPALVAMVSGGCDSVCMLDVAVAVRGADGVRALHVNYGLRGADADADERHTRELCARLGVALEVVRAGAEERARIAERGNLQAWARELRYAAARRLARELDGRAAVDAAEAPEPAELPEPAEPPEAAEPRNAAEPAEPPEVAEPLDPTESAGLPEPPEAAQALIVTGHTASDQLETILYRLAASPGRRALLGMAAREGRLVRPLLGVTRAQTAAYCRARGVGWREDASNRDELYARARVRHKLLPALRAVHPAAEASVLRTAAMLREEAALLDGLVDAELAGEEAIATARLRELPPALARLVVVRLAERAAGGYVPQAGARVQEILALAARGGPAELHVGGNVAAVIAGGELRMVRLSPRRGARA